MLMSIKDVIDVYNEIFAAHWPGALTNLIPFYILRPIILFSIQASCSPYKDQ